MPHFSTSLHDRIGEASPTLPDCFLTPPQCRGPHALRLRSHRPPLGGSSQHALLCPRATWHPGCREDVATRSWSFFIPQGCDIAHSWFSLCLSDCSFRVSSSAPLLGPTRSLRFFLTPVFLALSTHSWDSVITCWLFHIFSWKSCL